MKRKIFSIGTIGLFIDSIFSSLSENEYGHIFLIEKTHAEISPALYQAYHSLCHDENTKIIVCGQRNGTCFPNG